MPIAILGESMDEDISDLLAQFEEMKKAGPAAATETAAPAAAAVPEVTRPAPHKQEAPPASAPAPSIDAGLHEPPGWAMT